MLAPELDHFLTTPIPNINIFVRRKERERRGGGEEHEEMEEEGRKEEKKTIHISVIFTTSHENKSKSP